MSRVLEPVKVAICAASQPAWPPPTIMTSYFPVEKGLQSLDAVELNFRVSILLKTEDILL